MRIQATILGDGLADSVHPLRTQVAELLDFFNVVADDLERCRSLFGQYLNLGTLRAEGVSLTLMQYCCRVEISFS
jgi:hypothetical protein